MNLHELAERNHKLAEKRHAAIARGPRRLPKLDLPDLSTPGEFPENIAVICAGGLDYALFATPALFALRSAYPRAKITLLAHPDAEPVLRDNREANSVHYVPAFEDAPQAIHPDHFDDLPRRMRRMHYDAALVMSPTSWAGAWLATSAHIPRRLGLAGEGAETFLTTPVLTNPDKHPHVVQQNLDIVKRLVGAEPTTERRIRFWPDSAVTALAFQSALNTLHGETRPIVTIDPGDGLQPADWRDEGWAFVADQLVHQHDVRVVIAGGRGGTAQRQAVAERMRFEPMLVERPLDPLFVAALVGRSHLTLTGYTDTLHIAAALERPLVALYGPHNPAHVGPWGRTERQRILQSEMLCAPCGLAHWPDDSLDNHPCLREVDSYEVLETALNLLEEIISGAQGHRSIQRT